MTDSRFFDHNEKAIKEVTTDVTTEAAGPEPKTEEPFPRTKQKNANLGGWLGSQSNHGAGW